MIEYRKVTLSVSGDGSDKLELWSAQQGGHQLSTLSWDNLGGTPPDVPEGQDNWADLPSEVWVQPTGASSRVRDVTLKLSLQGWCPKQDGATEGYRSATHTDTVNVTSYRTGLKSVTFSGDSFHTVYVDTTGDPYGPPHWVDNSEPLNGNATDQGDERDPVCYARGSAVTGKARFLATPKGAFSGATIAGDGPGAVDFPEAAATWVQQPDGTWYAEQQIQSSAGVAGSVHRYAPFSVSWTLASAGGRGCSAQSNNEVFVSLGTPQCATLYRTVAYLACGNPGAENEPQALENTWDMFSDGTGENERPANVCAWNEEQRDYSRKLYYWQSTDPAPVSDVPGLLQTANGNCDAWVRIFHDALLSNQVEVTEIVVLPYSYPDVTWLVVKNVGWDEADPDFPDEAPWKYSYGDVLQEPEGLAGQNMETPAEKVFAWHHLRKRVIAGPPSDKRYYDPSYGQTFESKQQFTSHTIAGWGIVRQDGEVHFRKRAVGELVRFLGPDGWEEE